MNYAGSKILLVSISLVFLPALEAAAFHGGGTANCNGCHEYLKSASKGYSYILKGQDPSSVCLNCHEVGNPPLDFQVSTPDSFMRQGIPPRSMTPGGDFGWLKKNYTWVNNGIFYTEPGQSHGHNIVSLDFGYQADTENVTAPGGNYPANSLGCISCHDPHGLFRVSDDGTVNQSGKMITDSGSLSNNGVPVNPTGETTVGTYRMLAGNGYRIKGESEASTFVYDAPAAMAPSDYNRDETITQTRVAYGNGISLWCANCHSSYVSGGSSKATNGKSGPGDVGPHHGSDSINFDDITADRYNAYLKNGDLSGDGTDSYLSLVPFESPLGNNIADRDKLAAMARNDDLDLNGPSTRDRVNCLTCHRAHASGWNHMLRWNNDSPFLTYKDIYPGIDNGAPAEYHMGRTEAETRRAYYDRPADVFGSNQKRLCQKCHADRG